MLPYMFLLFHLSQHPHALGSWVPWECANLPIVPPSLSLSLLWRLCWNAAGNVLIQLRLQVPGHLLESGFFLCALLVLTEKPAAGQPSSGCAHLAFPPHLSSVSCCTSDCLAFPACFLAALLPIYFFVPLSGTNYKQKYKGKLDNSPNFQCIREFWKNSTVKLLICSQEPSHFQLVLFAWPFLSFGRLYHLSICLLIRLKKGLLLLRTLSHITSIIFFFSAQNDKMTCFCLVSPTEITWFLGFHAWWPRYNLIWRLNIWSVMIRERDWFNIFNRCKYLLHNWPRWMALGKFFNLLKFLFLSRKSRHVWVICLHWDACFFLSPLKKFAAYCFSVCEFSLCPCPFISIKAFISLYYSFVTCVFIYFSKFIEV